MMKMLIVGTKISFVDSDNNELMYIDYSTDECAWYFNDSKIIVITEDMELYKCLEFLMKQNYQFNDSEVLRNYKSANLLIWYSDCYFNPDDEWSLKSVSYLNIQYVDNVFKLWCIKPLDEIIDRKIKYHCICFSPLGNGKYAKNELTGLTLQDDFVIHVYHQLMNNNKESKLYRNKH